MRIGMLGTGIVGQEVGTRLVALGHEVQMGARRATNEAAASWAQNTGPMASVGDFAGAAAFGEVVVNATKGLVSIDALAAAGAQNLDGKVLVDIANALDYTGGFPPSVVQRDGVSLAEQIQRAFPGAFVVKAMSTMNAQVMLNPARLPARTSTFVAGEDDEAKAVVRGLLVGAGWSDDDVIDLGGLAAARGMELFLPLWLATSQALGTFAFNIAVVR
jgi:predicted dinucleotide-binding enzyme